MNFKKDLKDLLTLSEKVGYLKSDADRTYINQHGVFKREEDIKEYEKEKSRLAVKKEEFLENHEPKSFWQKFKELFL